MGFPNKAIVKERCDHCENHSDEDEIEQRM